MPQVEAKNKEIDAEKHLTSMAERESVSSAERGSARIRAAAGDSERLLEAASLV